MSHGEDKRKPNTVFGPTLTGDGSGKGDLAHEATREAPSVSGANASTVELRKIAKDAHASGDFESLVKVSPENYIEGEEIDRGGMGRVVRARDRRLGREVAIKELLIHSPERARRFEREARITARLQHPSIVTVHEAGMWREGHPFYAMDIVDGRSYAQAIEGELSLDDRLALLPHVIQIADALAYAHSQRIIHRDLKPSNVLIGHFGETVVIDWGLAKDLRNPEDDDAVDEPAARAGGELTVAGAVMGTPAYMSPEQATGVEVDERTDVYALGAILYHTLTGRAPYSGSSADEILSQVTASAPADVVELQRGIPEDLRAIVAKAMHRSLDERYPTALELSRDLNRFRRGKLVAAHSYSTAELVWRWMRRHKALLLVSVTALAVAASTLAVSFFQIVEERDRAEQSRKTAAALANDILLEQATSQLQDAPDRALATLERLPSGEDANQLQRARVIAMAAQAAGLPKLLPHDQKISSLHFAKEDALLVIHNKMTVDELALDGSEPQRRAAHDQRLNILAVADDGDRFAAASDDATIRVWRRSSPSTQVLRGHSALIIAVAFFPGGERVLSTSLDGTIRVWNLSDLSHRILPGPEKLLTRLRVSRDGRLVAAGGGDGQARIWSAETGELLHEFAIGEERAQAVDFDYDNKRLALGLSNGVKVYSLDSKQVVELPKHDSAVAAVRFAGDGSLATIDDRVIRIWNRELEEVHALPGKHGFVGMEISKEGDVLTAHGYDGSVSAWQIGEKHATSLLGTAPAPDASEIVVSESGRRIAVLRNTSIQIWDLDDHSARAIRLDDSEMNRVSFSENGQSLLTASPSSVRIFSKDGAELGRIHPNHSAIGETGDTGMSPRALVAVVPLEKNGVAVTIDVGGRVTHWKSAEEPVMLPGRANGTTSGALVSPNQRILAAGGVLGELRLWDLETGEARMLSVPGKVDSLAFSANGRYLAAALGSKLSVWDMKDGERKDFDGHEEGITGLYMSDSGDCLVTGDNAGSIRRWNREDGTHEIITSDKGWIRELHVADSCRTIAWLDQNDRAHLYSLSTARMISTSTFDDLALSKSGELLAGSSTGLGFVLFNARSGSQLLHRPGAPSAMAFSPDNVSLAMTRGGTLHLLRLEVPDSPGELRKWLEARTP